MNMDAAATAIASWLGALPLHYKILLTIASTSFVTEMVLRAWGRSTVAYRRWSKALEAVGRFWTAIILGVVYFLPVQMTSLALRLFGKDPLQHRADRLQTFWQRPPPNPLDASSAARHQF